MINEDQDIIDSYEKEISDLIDKRDELFNYIYYVDTVEWGEPIIRIRPEVPKSIFEIVKKELKKVEELISVRSFELEQIKGIEGDD